MYKLIYNHVYGCVGGFLYWPGIQAWSTEYTNRLFDLDMGIRRNLDRAKRGPLATTMDRAYHGSDKRIRLG